MSNGLGDISFDESGTASGFDGDDDGGGGGDGGDSGPYSDTPTRGEQIDESRDDDGPFTDQPTRGEQIDESRDDDGGDDAGRDTQLEQETGVDTGDVESGEAAAPPTAEEDLTQTDQELGPSGDETSGFDDPDQLEGGLGDLRFAAEETTVETPGGGERTYQEGEALPTQYQRALQIEGAVASQDPRVGREDVAVTQTSAGLAPDLTQAGEQQIERQQEFREVQQTRSREEQAQAIETGLEAQLSVTQTGDPGPGGVQFDPVDLQRDEDFTIQETGEGRIQGQLTEDFQRQWIAGQFREQIGRETAATGLGFDPGDELDIDLSGDEPSVELTPEGREDFVRQVAAETGEIGGEEVQSLDQLQFDEQGELTGVAEAQDAGFWENIGRAQSSGLVGLPGAVAIAGTEETLDVVEDVSGEAADIGSRTFDRGAAGFSSRMAVASPYAGGQDTDITETDTGAEKLLSGAGAGISAVTIGGPEQLSSTGELIGSAGAFTVEQPEAAPAAGTAFAATKIAETAEAAEQRPYRFTGNIVGSSIAGTAVSPIRFGRVDVPRRGDATTLPRPTRPSVDIDAPSVSRPSVSIGRGGVDVERPRLSGGLDVDVERPRLEQPDATRVRGIRLRDPIAYEQLTGRVEAGDTLVGFAGARPSVGTPEINPRTVDFGELSGRGQTFEPVGGFESEVYSASARAAGGQAARRFAAREQLMDVGQQAESDLALGTTEEIVGQARAVPESAVSDVARGLEDIDATIEGSAAVRAQLDEGFRQPRDIDILLREERQAPKSAPIEEQFPESGPVLQRSLEGETADVGDVFDIKVAGEGRPDVGQFVKGGRTAQPRLETEGGVQVTAIGEELTRKASASGFLRGPGSPAPEFTGRTADFDVGPEPARAGERPRFKDPADAYEIGRAVAPESEAVQQFGRAFETEITQADRGPSAVDVDEAAPATLAEPQPFGAGLRQEFGEFLADEQAQATAVGFLGRADVDRPRDIDTDTETATATQRADVEADTSPSPGRVDTSPSPGIAAPSVSPSPGVAGPSPSQPFTSPGGVSPETEAPTTAGSPADTAADTGTSPFTGGGGGLTSPTGGGAGGSPGGPSGGGVPGSPGDVGEGGGFGFPGSPGGPFVPVSTPAPQPRPGATTDRDSGDEFRPAPTAPTGQEFFNPVATGQSFLFGGSVDGNDETPTNPFLG